jgi:hypothetical protein
MSQQPDSLRDMARSRFFWPCAVALVLAVLFALIPGVPASLEVLVDAALIVLLGAIASTEKK